MDYSLLKKIQEIILKESAEKNRISEDLLAEQIGRSRTPIRAVLQHLEEYGWIERRHKSGIRLRKIPIEEALEIYDLRGILEGLACHMLAQRPNEKILRQLHQAEEDHLKAMQANRSRAEISLKDIAFHRLILENCGARHLPRLITTLEVVIQTMTLMHQTFPKPRYFPRRILHGKIIAAIAEGNPKKAEKVMRIHIEKGKQTLIKPLRANCAQGKTGKEVMLTTVNSKW